MSNTERSERRPARVTAADRRFAKKNRLAAPTPFSMRTVEIPLRDGERLGADLYEPSGESKGLLVARGPYGRSGMIAAQMARPYAAQGYTVLFVSSRGTYDSTGAFDPMRSEVVDGQDLVSWMRQQPWYPGRFATIGGSYLGHTQWAMLTDPPADLVTSIIMIGPHDFSRHAWGTGTFNLDFLGWSDQIVVQSKHEGLAAMLKLVTQGRRVNPILNAVPIATAAHEHFTVDAPWVAARLERPDLDDPFWAPMQHAEALEKVRVPVLLVTGWQDIFVRQAFEQFSRLSDRGGDVALISGPWTHIQVTRAGGPEINPRMFSWLDAAFAGRRPTAGIAPVRAFVGGAGEWRDLESWPPASTERTLSLAAGSRLVEEASHPGSDAFTYNPATPTPTVGGPIIDFRHGGTVDDTSLSTRNDVLVYTGDSLDAGLTIMGTVRVSLAHHAERADADLFVRLSDVDPKGRSKNVTEGYVRLSSASDSAAVALDLLPTAHRFGKGHRIRLYIAGGSFPQFARNPGTGANPLTTAELIANRHTIALEGSEIRLPVVD